jgi:hypothetical protein
MSAAVKSAAAAMIHRFRPRGAHRLEFLTFIDLFDAKMLSRG